MELKRTIDMNGLNGLYGMVDENGDLHDATNGDIIAAGLTMLVQQCHAASYNRGWWHDPITGLSLIPGHQPFGEEGVTVNGNVRELIEAWFPYVIATKIALIHSEVSEGLEAYRVDKQDDKIPFPGITAEMGDVLIRVADLMGCLQQYHVANTKGEVPEAIHQYDLGAAILAKLPVNGSRSDHDLAKRAQPGGKKF